jgi:uncharacterized protein
MLAVVGIITAVLIGKVIERRSLSEVGLGRRGLIRNILQGLSIGTGMVLLYFLAVIPVVLLGLLPEAANDGTTIDTSMVLQQLQQAGGVLGYLGLTFIFVCLVAVFEEIVFRGLIFRIVEEGLGSWLALAISSLLFGMSHLGQAEHQTLLSVAPQVALGFSLAAAYMLTRKLWLSMSIHFAWDLILLVISGGLLTFSDASSDAGTSSVSAGAALILSIPELVVAIVLLALAIRRGQIRTPRWMQRKRIQKKPYIDKNAPPLTEEKAVDEMVAS